MIVRVLALILSGFAVHATPIVLNGVVTSGSATRTTGFSGTLQGLDFSLTGSGTSYNQFMKCLANQACFAPGSYSMLDGAAGPILDEFSPDFGSGTFTKDGTLYGCGVPSGLFRSFPCGFEIGVGYTLNLPDFGSSPPSELVLTTPLTVHAELGYEGLGCPAEFCELIANGVGTATLTLDRVVIPGVGPLYSLQSAQYDFFAVPEPATMTLAGLGLLAIILSRFRSRAQTIIGCLRASMLP